MEELGIGRPSTYASIITTIQDRAYVRKEKNRLFAEDKGRLVTAFLMEYFPRYVEYDFTAALEEELDDVSGGRVDWKAVLGRFWEEFSKALDGTTELRISEVLEKINEVLGPHVFPDRGDGSDPRQCPLCGQGRLSIKTSSKTQSAFIGCDRYPECRYTRPFGTPDGDDGAGLMDGKVLGHDPETGLPVTIRSGRFGPYLQLGEATEEQPKPKRASIPKGRPLDQVTLEEALSLLSLPRKVGDHPEDGEPVEAGIGRYGPYVKHGRTYANLEDGDDVLTVGMNRAMDLIARKAARGAARGGAAKPLRELGEHPDGGQITVHEGRYGPYVKWGKVNATLPKESDPAAVTLEEAVTLVDAKKGPKKSPKKAKAESGTGKTAEKKSATRKTASKKTAGSGTKGTRKKAASAASGRTGTEDG
jgi:DNA topoisomerase-1